MTRLVRCFGARSLFLSWLLLTGVLGHGCSDPTSPDGASARSAPDTPVSSPEVRFARRAYEGAPPVVPHRDFSGACIDCHNQRGVSVDGVGFAPPSPHGATHGMGAARCQQCHVVRVSDDLFVRTSFQGLEAPAGASSRHHPLAPPVLPHPAFMRENCLACHSGPAAREGLATSHPERQNCRQCHVPQTRAEPLAALARETNAEDTR